MFLFVMKWPSWCVCKWVVIMSWSAMNLDFNMRWMAMCQLCVDFVLRNLHCMCAFWLMNESWTYRKILVLVTISWGLELFDAFECLCVNVIYFSLISAFNWVWWCVWGVLWLWYVTEINVCVRELLCCLCGAKKKGKKNSAEVCSFCRIYAVADSFIF